MTTPPPLSRICHQAAELAKLSELDNAVDVAGASLTRAQHDADAAAAANAAAKQELAARR